METMNYQTTKYEARYVSPSVLLIQTEDSFVMVPIFFAVAVDKDQLAGLSDEEISEVIMSVIDSLCTIPPAGSSRKTGEA